MYVLQRFDPYIDMGESEWTEITSTTDARARVIETYDYWRGMTEPGAEFPAGTRVTLNSDYEPDPSVYFLTLTFPEAYAAEHDHPEHQTDLFFVIRDDTTDPVGCGDVSEIGGAQCGDCGAVNVTHEGTVQEVRPVWRGHPETANMLCDPCADMRWMRTWCTERGYSWDDDGPIEPHADAEWRAHLGAAPSPRGEDFDANKVTRMDEEVYGPNPR